MMKRKPDIVIIITAAMFGAAIAVMIAALICMALDVFIYHLFIPQAIVLIVVTGVAFVVSLALRFSHAKAANIDSTEQGEDPQKSDKRTKAVRGLGVTALICFYVALACNAVSHLCDGLAAALTKYFYMLAVLAAGMFAAISVILSRRSPAEKSALLHLISRPFVFALVCIAFMAVFAVALFFLMLMSWRDWGLI